jgi:hypothetical protein
MGSGSEDGWEADCDWDCGTMACGGYRAKNRSRRGGSDCASSLSCFGVVAIVDNAGLIRGRRSYFAEEGVA